jgi:signal transduction histidine kinase
MGFIIEDVYRCKEIVKSLLAYSRRTAQAKGLHEWNAVVEQALVLIRDQKIFANIKVIRDFSEEMMMVNIDKNQINQVIINLVMNAVAAMNEEGTLTLRTYRDKASHQVFLEVRDTGCGIPKQNLGKIFDPFFTTKEPGKGTGLGLSTVYGLVQENGGDVSVKKTGPEGTTFLVKLPLYVASAGPDGEERRNDR